MTHWSERVSSDLSRSLATKGVEVVNEPTDRPKRFEAITLAKIVDTCLEEGFAPVGDRLDLSRTNHAPYRRVTQGSGVNQRPELPEIDAWVSPIVELRRGDRWLSFFREGSPFLRSRDRPDILVYPGRFETETGSDPFVGDHVVLSWEGRRSGERRYKRETDANGPVVAESRGHPSSPLLGVEVSFNKSCDRLLEQVDILRDLDSEAIAAVLAHDDPCPDGKSPSDATVATAVDERTFRDGVERVTDSLLETLE